jgi:NAD(P)H-hydrate epimerase
MDVYFDIFKSSVIEMVRVVRAARRCVSPSQLTFSDFLFSPFSFHHPYFFFEIIRMVSLHRLAFVKSAPLFFRRPPSVLPLLSFSYVACSQSKTALALGRDSDSQGMRSFTGYLNANDAYQLDIDLFNSSKYTLEQLMELAGLSVAEAVYTVLNEKQKSETDEKPSILVICGPGNNGGDGLVAARHLVFFGFNVHVLYPKRSKREEHYEKLLQQCMNVGVTVLDDDNNGISEYFKQYRYDGIIDAIFGFSFTGVPRPPFQSIIDDMNRMQMEHGTLIFSVDVPSGWNVDEGDVESIGLEPDVLISLTAPKLCSQKFQGRHFVGGRFLPNDIAEKYNIRMPTYPGVAQVVELKSDEKSQQSIDEKDWAAEYAAYCAEKEKKLDQENDASSSTDAKDDDWAVQYHNYCVEKEEKINVLDKQDTLKISEKGSSNGNWEEEYSQYLAEKEREEKGLS